MQNKKRSIIKEAINQHEYTTYVCEIVNGKIVINEGFEYPNDAKERIREQKDEGHTEGLTFKVFSGKFLKQKGVDPNNDANWGNPSYIKKNVVESKKINKMQNKKETTKVSRQKIEEVTSLIKKIQQLTGKKVIFEDAKQSVKESKEQKLEKIKSLVKMIESKTGKKVVFGDTKVTAKKK